MLLVSLSNHYLRQLQPVPQDVALLSRHEHMLLSKKASQGSSSKAYCVLLRGRESVYLKQLGQIRANVDTAVLVPNKTGELKLRVVVLIFNHLEPI